VTFVDPILQTAIILGGTVGLAVTFGLCMARMISYEIGPLERTLALVGNKFYNCRTFIDNKSEMQGCFYNNPHR
jgi:hypothetical protein